MHATPDLTRRPSPARRAWRLTAPLAVLAWITLQSAPAGAGAGAAPDSTNEPRVSSVADSPGYVPLVDPESTAVLTGRRENAPRVRRPFTGGTRSLDDLGRAICRGIHHSDYDSLMSLCVTDEEFRDILWREFPQSRPATGLQWEDGWRVLTMRLTSGMRGAIQDLGGHHYEFVRFEADSMLGYRNFKMYSRLTLVVRDDTGRTQEWKWVRGVVERKGRFKIYSSRD